MRLGLAKEEGQSWGSCRRVPPAISQHPRPLLQPRLGSSNVIASDVKLNRSLLNDGPFVYCE